MCGGDKVTIIRREYFPVRKQVKLTEQLIINGTALPYAYSFDGAADITVRAKSEKRGYSHGSTISGDGFIDGKKITLGFVIEGGTPAEHDAKLNDLYQLMYQRDYQLHAGYDRGYYNIACMYSTKEKWIKGFKGRKGEVDITLLLADPFRYANSEAEAEFNYADSVKEAEMFIYSSGSIIRGEAIFILLLRQFLYIFIGFFLLHLYSLIYIVESYSLQQGKKFPQTSPSDNITRILPFLLH